MDIKYTFHRKIVQIGSMTLEYLSSDIGVKESLILDVIPETNQFRYAFTLKGMFAEKNGKGEGITLYSEDDGESIAAIEVPYT